VSKRSSVETFEYPKSKFKTKNDRSPQVGMYNKKEKKRKRFFPSAASSTGEEVKKFSRKFFFQENLAKIFQ
jgi:hypothetical protein